MFRTSIFFLLLALALISCARTSSSPATAEGKSDESPKSDPETPSRAEPKPEQGWESSGGDGVACFETETLAEQAETQLKEQRSLKKDLKEKIQSLVTLDYWDYSTDYTFITGSDRDALLADVHRFLEKHSPIFFSRLKLTFDKIDYAHWQKNEKLSNIEDSNPRKSLKDHPKCRLIQLAVRHSRSRTGLLPEVYIEIDKELFEAKLDPLNQAILIAHEELYVLGKETPVKHRTSDDIRRLVAFLFLEKTRKKVNEAIYPSLGSRIVQSELGYHYGDYYLFFRDEAILEGPSTGGVVNQRSRYLSFGSLLDKLRTRKTVCLDESKYDKTENLKEKEQILRACNQKAIYGSDLSEALTEEENFVYLARWLADGEGAVENSENLVVWFPGQSGKETVLQSSELKRLCQFASKVSVPEIFANIIVKTQNYCTRVGLVELKYGAALYEMRPRREIITDNP